MDVLELVLEGLFRVSGLGLKGSFKDSFKGILKGFHKGSIVGFSDVGALILRIGASWSCKGIL